MWGLGLSRERLQELGLLLGADVPVFVFGENAYAEGVGEQLQAYAVPDAWYVVLFPPAHVATAEVFAHLDFANLELTKGLISRKISGLSLQSQRNDLQSVVCALYPEVARYLVWLGQFSQARMSGSGACVFSEFVTEAQALAVIEHLPSDMRGVVARGLSQHPLRDFAVM
jgi:4-diphosphocytidyl-2-C-methyl-D-erythritol kinase